MSIPYDTRLPPDLRALKQEIEGYARDYGLDFYETIFEVLDAEDLNEVAAYGGFPTRYPHWSFGMAYEELIKGYDYGLSKIYEMVINNDPCYAYLMRCNHTVDQKLVMAHVYGHCLAPETLIETLNGVKPITEVKVGEQVLTHTGAFRRVKVCARRHFKGNILSIAVEGSSDRIRITAEHPLYCLVERTPRQRSLRPFSRWLMTWMPAGEIRTGDLLVRAHAVAVGKTSAASASYVGTPYLDVGWGESLDSEIYLRVASVEQQTHDGYVYNFSVEEDESYTLAAGMVVHNCDFFKNNAYFGHTSRKMMDEMANHGMRLRRYVEKYGEDEVEAFIDRCMSIDDLIDIHSTAIRRREEVQRYDFKPQEEEDLRPTRFKSKSYMDDYINPPEALKAEEEEQRKQREQAARSFPERPEKDVLLFLIDHAPIKPWQRDVLSIIRDEAYYFAPQGQTKVINEGWACADRKSILFSDAGCIRLGDVVDNRRNLQVSDGETTRQVYDWAMFPNRKTVRIRTRRGFELEGSVTHRIMMANGTWRRLDEVSTGDVVKTSPGPDLWAQEKVAITWQLKRRVTLQEVAARAGVDIETVIRYRKGTRGKHALVLAPLVREYEESLATCSQMQNKRRPIRLPEVLDEDLAAVLGFISGDGHISKVKREIGLTTGDEEQANRFMCLIERVFGLRPRKKWDEGRWRIRFSSQHAQEFLVHLGMKTGVCARIKDVPDAILRSPKSVVAAFLRALYDSDGYGGKAGVILSTSSIEMGKTVQLLLLNFGILSTRRLNKRDNCWHVHTTGKSAVKFLAEIGFGLQRKQQGLRDYIENHRWFLKEDWTDKIVAIERRRADVYDISVEETHRYAAQGFINHNSYWHSTIMTTKALSPTELIDYADHHSGTMATQRGRINPYKLGIELLRDIEQRWNTGRFGKEYDDCDDLEKRRKWDKQLGLGRKKIFEVRRVHNDITFIDTFLTPEFCVEHQMFSYAFQEQTGNYVIESREFDKIKKRLLFSLTNFGKPWIYVVDGNYRNRGELLLRHEYNGLDLKLDRAADTLGNVQAIWGRPVHLQTVVEDKPTLMSYDGTEHSIRNLGDADDPRKHAAGKTK